MMKTACTVYICTYKLHVLLHVHSSSIRHEPIVHEASNIPAHYCTFTAVYDMTFISRNISPIHVTLIGMALIFQLNTNVLPMLQACNYCVFNCGSIEMKARDLSSQ